MEDEDCGPIHETMQPHIHPYWLQKRGFSKQELQSKILECSCILEKLVNPSTQTLENIWVAGGFFTPYIIDTDRMYYQNNQCMDVYITQLPMEFGHEIPDNVLTEYINPEYLKCNPIVREERKNVPFFATFLKPIRVVCAGVNSQSSVNEASPNETFPKWFDVNVKVFFCYESITSIVNSFTLEPCKIGLRYGDRNLFFGKWFLVYDPDNIVSRGKRASKEFLNRYLVYKRFGNVAPFESLHNKGEGVSWTRIDLEEFKEITPRTSP